MGENWWVCEDFYRSTVPDLQHFPFLITPYSWWISALRRKCQQPFSHRKDVSNPGSSALTDRLTGLMVFTFSVQPGWLSLSSPTCIWDTLSLLWRSSVVEKPDASVTASLCCSPWLVKVLLFSHDILMPQAWCCGSPPGSTLSLVHNLFPYSSLTPTYKLCWSVKLLWL